MVYLLPIEVSLDPPSAVDVPGATAPGTTDPTEAEAAMAGMVLAFRAERGLGPLTREGTLDRVARAHADDMAEGGFFGHVSPTRGDLDTRLRAGGVASPRAAENLAVGPSAEAAFASLLESPAHRASFLDRASRVSTWLPRRVGTRCSSPSSSLRNVDTLSRRWCHGVRRGGDP